MAPGDVKGIGRLNLVGLGAPKLLTGSGTDGAGLLARIINKDMQGSLAPVKLEVFENVALIGRVVWRQGP